MSEFSKLKWLKAVDLTALTGSEAKILKLIYDRTGGDGREAIWYNAAMAGAAGCSTKSVERAIARLIKLRLIDRTQKGNGITKAPSHYDLVRGPDGLPLGINQTDLLSLDGHSAGQAHNRHFAGKIDPSKTAGQPHNRHQCLSKTDPLKGSVKRETDIEMSVQGEADIFDDRPPTFAVPKSGTAQEADTDMSAHQKADIFDDRPRASVSPKRIDPFDSAPDGGLSQEADIAMSAQGKADTEVSAQPPGNEPRQGSALGGHEMSALGATTQTSAEGSDPVSFDPFATRTRISDPFDPFASTSTSTSIQDDSWPPVFEPSPEPKEPNFDPWSMSWREAADVYRNAMNKQAYQYAGR